jgi:hypothetical protein
MPTACVLEQQLGDESDSTGESVSTDPSAEGTAGDPAIPVEEAAATMAAARCAAYFACDCAVMLDEELWIDQAACEADVRPWFDEQVSIGEELGLQYEPSCVAEYIAFYEAPGCAASSDVSAQAYAEVVQCELFHGSAQVGESCESDIVFLPGVDDCAPELTCVNGFCEALKAEGQPCNGVAAIQPDCEHPLFCDPAQSPPSCQPRRAIGGHCDDDEMCGPDGFCQDETCVPTQAPGESCWGAGECTYGHCTEFTCVAVAAACTPWSFEISDSCGDGRSAAADFIEANSACEVDEDCVALDAICYEGTPCGSISVNVDYDPEAWAEISAALDTCQGCGANACGFPVACIDGRCDFEP